MSDFREEVDRVLIVVLTFIVFCGILFTWFNPCQAEVVVLNGSSSIIVTPGQLPTQTYTSPSGTTTIQPPVGLPTHVYPGTNGGATTVVPPVGLPTFIYGR